MLTHTETIGLWDTIADFARDIDVGYEAARKMSERNSIHSDHWQDVVNAAKKRGFQEVSLEQLSQAKSKRKTHGCDGASDHAAA